MASEDDEVLSGDHTNDLILVVDNRQMSETQSPEQLVDPEQRRILQEKGGSC